MDLDHFLPMGILEAGKLGSQILKILMNSTPQRNSLLSDLIRFVIDSSEETSGRSA